MHQQNQLIQAQHILVKRRRRRRRRRVVRNIWVRDWIARRPQLGLYDRLMVGLRNENPRAFTRFMRIPPAMHDEIVQRLTPALIKQTTNWRAPLEPGLKVDCRFEALDRQMWRPAVCGRFMPRFRRRRAAFTRDEAVLWQWNDRFTSVINSCLATMSKIRNTGISSLYLT